MIVKLIGKLELINKDSIHIEVSGIVYKIFMSSKDLNVLDPEIKNLEIEINEIFRDDVRYLFGFLHLNSKIMFENLIKVHGVGGKMALNVLSLLEVSEMIEAVKNNNFISFTKVSGIGNKLGQRLINELKDKIDIVLDNSNLNLINKNYNSEKLNDLKSCLINLGFQAKLSDEISRNVIEKEGNVKLEQLIPIALKNIRNHK